MNLVYVDTSALIAFGNSADKYHQQSIEVRAELRQKNTMLITTSATILETANTFSKAPYKSLFLAVFNMVKTSTQWKYLIVDDDMMNEGVKLFANRQDKDWSLVDCIGVNVARSMNIERIFTTDKHFKQAGFEILLK